jgi:multidrug transporter EmrE-like cation transporter
LAYVALIVAIGSTAFAQLFYKLYFTTKRSTYLFVTIFLFFLTMLMNYIALKTFTVSTVYMMTALTYVLVLSLSKVVLNETISRQKLQAVILIIAGIALFNF